MTSLFVMIICLVFFFTLLHNRRIIRNYREELNRRTDLNYLSLETLEDLTTARQEFDDGLKALKIFDKTSFNENEYNFLDFRKYKEIYDTKKDQKWCFDDYMKISDQFDKNNSYHNYNFDDFLKYKSLYDAKNNKKADKSAKPNNTPVPKIDAKVAVPNNLVGNKANTPAPKTEAKVVVPNNLAGNKANTPAPKTDAKVTVSNKMNVKWHICKLDIYKRTPQTDCGECGISTCYAFSEEVASSKVRVDKCPYMTTAIKAEVNSIVKEYLKDINERLADDPKEEVNRLNNFKEQEKWDVSLAENEIFQIDDKTKIIGFYVEDGLFKGKKYHDDRLIAEGTFFNGLQVGYGKMYNHYNENLQYEGEFKHGTRCGKGMEFNIDGNMVRKGEFYKNGEFRGELYIYNNEKLYCKCNGSVVVNISSFRGEFSRRYSCTIYGYGEIFYANGKIAKEGMLGGGTNGSYDYFNLIKVADCSKYFNIFLAEGKEYYENGKIKYEGSYDRENYNGQGKEYYKNGKIKCIGNFELGKLEGQGKYYKEDGSLIYEGNFEKGVPEIYC